MADKKIVVDVESNLKEQITQAKEFNKELDKTQSKKPATRTGSRAADAALGTSERGLTRGTSGTGGRGDERDFARQAQGLGGLVRVYATFAANIYAVTAAFSALSKAADTSNMIRAAQSLSATYGVALRNVSKDLQTITDGALSSAEALGFANLGGSAGLTVTQMGKLATVAKGASLALGRDLTDSLQRVYRGAIKVEPELLDELGLMVKIDDAAKEYARGLNKTVLQLTDFERRQAFVNAVITQGTQKFGEIAEQSANPYTKLLASIQNLSKDGLGLVNNVLAPMAELLSRSPTALISAAALVAGKLANLAIPGLVANVEGKLDNVGRALEVSSKKLQEANKAVIKSFEGTAGFKFISSDASSKLIGQAAKLRKQLNESLYKDLEASGTGPIKLSLNTEALIKQYESALVKAQKNAEATLSKGNLTPAGTAGLNARTDALKEELALTNSIKQGFSTFADDERIAAEVRKQQNKDTLAVMKTQNALSVLQLQAEEQHLKAIGQAFLLEREVTKEKNKQVVATGLLGAAQKATNSGIGVVVGGFKAAQAGIMGLVSKLPMIGLAVGLISLAFTGLESGARHFGLLSDIADKNNEKFNSFKETVKSLGASLDKLSKAKTIDEAFSLKTASLQLLIQSRKELVDITEGFKEFEKSGTGLDKFLDNAKGLFGMDTQADKFKAASGGQLAKQAQSAGGLKGLGIRGELASEAFKQNLTQGKILDTKNLSDVDLLKAWVESLPKGSELKKIAELQSRITKNTIADDESKLARQQDLITSQVELSKVTKDYANSLVTQVPALKAQRELISGLGAALESTEGASKYILGFTSELATVTNTTLNPVLERIRNQLVAIDAAPAIKGLSEEENLKARADAKKSILDQANVFGLLTSQVFETIKSTNELTQASANSEKAVAMLNRQLRQISAIESVTGKSFSTETARQNAQAAIQAEQVKGINTQISILSRLEKGTVNSTQEDLNAKLGTNFAAKDSMALLKELEKFKATTDEQRLLIANAFKTLGQYGPALAQAKTSRAVLGAGEQTELERALALDEAVQGNLKKSRDEKLKSDTEISEATKALAGVFTEISPALGAVFNPQLSKQQSDRALEANANATTDIEARQDKLGLVTAGKNISQTDIDAEKTRLQIALDAQKATRDSLLAQIPLREALNELNLQDLNYNNKIGQISTKLEIQQTVLEDINSTLAEKIASQEASIELTKAETQVNKDLSNAKIDVYKKGQDQPGATADVKAQLQLDIDAELLKQEKDRLVVERKITEQKKAQRTLTMREAEDTGMVTKKYFEDLYAYTAEYARQKNTDMGSIGEKFGRSMVDGMDATIDKFGELIQTGELSFKNIANFARNTFSDVLRDIANDIMKNVFRQLVNGVLSQTSGGGGLLGTIFNSVGGAILGGLGGVGGTSVQDSWDPRALRTEGFAKGGIMSNYGPVQLQKYAKGGVASSPQLALFGEGRTNEAYVPLPDNRSIPVTLSGNSGGVTMGDTNISISVDSSGNTDTSVEGNAEFARTMSMAVKRAVQDELIKQARPGGMMYNK